MTTERFIDGPDLDPRMRLSRILQLLSPEVAPGSDWPTAKAGDLLFFFEDGSDKLVPGALGATVQPVVFEEKYVEWVPGRVSKGPPVGIYDFSPMDAEWVIGSNGRKSCVRSSTGNKIERTAYGHMLVDGYPTTFSFRSKAFPVGQSFSRAAGQVRVKIDDEVVLVVGAFYRFFSGLERNERGETWYEPRFKRIAAFGEPNGPSLEQVRRAKALRFEFKTAEEQRKKLSAPSPTPALTRGPMTITSGLGPSPASQSWAAPRPPAEIIDPKPSAQPAKAVDPKLNDDLNDLPWSE